MVIHDCPHLNCVRWGVYWCCFDCDAANMPPARGSLCPVCGIAVESLDELTAHAVAAHPLPEAVGA